jgi:hypothetical protein
MTAKKSRSGRPTKMPAPGQRVSLGLKVTAETKRRIDLEAQASGRTQSQEAERRIELSFEYERAFGEARKVLADARQINTDNMKAMMFRDGWQQVRGIGGSAWFEPGADYDRWLAENTSSIMVDEIAERAAIRAIQKVKDNEG